MDPAQVAGMLKRILYLLDELTEGQAILPQIRDFELLHALNKAGYVQKLETNSDGAVKAALSESGERLFAFLSSIIDDR